MAKSASADPKRPQKVTILSTLQYVYRENGLKGLYRGVTPRIGLGIWQTVCMVSFADYVKAWYVADPELPRQRSYVGVFSVQGQSKVSVTRRMGWIEAVDPLLGAVITDYCYGTHVYSCFKWDAFVMDISRLQSRGPNQDELRVSCRRSLFLRAV